jgi:hypothetical protein
VTALGRWWRRIAGATTGILAAAAATGVAVAAWSDREPIADAQLRAGTVIVRVNGAASVTIPVTITPQVGATSTAYTPLTVTNNGDIPIDYRLEDTTPSSATTGLITSLSLGVGRPASAATCSAGAAGTAVALTTGTVLQDAAFVTLRPLAAGASEVLCVTLTAPAVTNAAFREGTATIVLLFRGQNQ